MIRAWLRRRREEKLEALEADRLGLQIFLNLVKSVPLQISIEEWDEAETLLRELEREIQWLEAKLS